MQHHSPCHFAHILPLLLIGLLLISPHAVAQEGETSEEAPLLLEARPVRVLFEMQRRRVAGGDAEHLCGGVECAVVVADAQVAAAARLDAAQPVLGAESARCRVRGRRVERRRWVCLIGHIRRIARRQRQLFAQPGVSGAYVLPCDPADLVSDGRDPVCNRQSELAFAQSWGRCGGTDRKSWDADHRAKRYPVLALSFWRTYAAQ